MRQSGVKLLLTGKPGCGKTTLIKKIVGALPSAAVGFYTEEIRGAHGRRKGFSLLTLDGRRGTLAAVGTGGHHRVGRYRVNLDCVDRLAVASLHTEDENLLIVIDEVGKMECLSGAFCNAVRRALDGPNPVLGTVALGGAPFIREIRDRDDIELIEVTADNRQSLAGELVEILETRTDKWDENEVDIEKP